jgi:transglutaminase-like putative cysteine protease
VKVLPRFLYLLCFIGMAAAAALALDRALAPSMSTILLRAVIVASLCGASGLVHRKAWPVSLVLLPVGAYLLVRTIMPPGSEVEGIGGLYRFYVEQLGVGASQYAAKYFPLNLASAPELRLLLGFTVYLLTGLAAFLALSLRRPVPGIALAVLLLGFSFTVDTLPRVVGMGVLFFVLAACLLVFSRGLERRTWRLRDAIPGVAVAVVGAVLAVLLLGAAPSAAAAPWQDWRAWDPFNQGGYVYSSFNWLQNYPKLLDPGNDVEIMKVQSPRPSYWRANALDQFTGEAWISSQNFTQEVNRTQEQTGYVYSIPAPEPSPQGQTATERFQVRLVLTNYLFSGGDPRSLTLTQDAMVRMNDMRSLHVVNALGPDLDYTLNAVIPKVTPSSLVGLGSDYPVEVQSYRELPFPRVDQLGGTDKEATWRATVPDAAPDGAQWADLYSLNQKMIGDATDPYEIALRLERYLRQSYKYTLEPPASELPSAYAAFLFDTRAGYCQHFAGAMAMLLRFNGVPARVAVGFTSGELESAGLYSVSTGNAHAWVEAYFPTVGWVAFDPTPGRNLPTPGASSTSPGFKDPFAATTDGQTSSPTDTPTTFPNRQSGEGSTATKSGPNWISSAAWLPWVLGVVLVLVAWPVGRRLWRERGLRRGTMGQRLTTSLQLLRSDLSAYGMPVAGSQTIEEVLDLVEHRLGVKRDQILASRAGAVLFGGRPPTFADFERAEAFRQKVGARLRKQYGRLRTVLSWYGLRWAAPARSPAPESAEAPLIYN